MKSQINIEFIISVGIFISVIIIIASDVVHVFPAEYENIRQEKVKNKAYQVSEILLFSKGIPENWPELEISQISTIGLAIKRYDLNLSKILALEAKCNIDYESMSNLILQDKSMRIVINITDSFGNQIAQCIPPTISRFVNFYEIIRYSTVNNELVKISIGVIL